MADARRFEARDAGATIDQMSGHVRRASGWSVGLLVALGLATTGFQAASYLIEDLVGITVAAAAFAGLGAGLYVWCRRQQVLGRWMMRLEWPFTWAYVVATVVTGAARNAVPEGSAAVAVLLGLVPASICFYTAWLVARLERAPGTAA